MTKTEIAETLRQEVGELEVAITKLQARCEKLKTFVLELESEIAGPEAQNQRPVADSKFRKAIDRVFGEKPKRLRR
jgi:phage shock protein A